MSRKAVGRWQLERRLGAGSFASVFLASRRPDGGAVAALDAGLRQDGLKKNDAGDDGADGDVQSHTAENQSQYGMIGNNAGPWPERVAIKAISRSKLTKKLERNLQKEVSILQGLVHDNIVALLETVETGRHILCVSAWTCERIRTCPEMLYVSTSLSIMTSTKRAMLREPSVCCGTC